MCELALKKIGLGRKTHKNRPVFILCVSSKRDLSHQGSLHGGALAARCSHSRMLQCIGHQGLLSVALSLTLSVYFYGLR
jgi:hypothetical protein